MMMSNDCASHPANDCGFGFIHHRRRGTSMRDRRILFNIAFFLFVAAFAIAVVVVVHIPQH